MKLVLIIIGLIILYKIYNCNNIENFDTLPTSTIIGDELSKLIDITNELCNKDTINVPSNMNVNGNVIVSDTSDGTLNITGTFNLLPSGVVVSWWGSNVPSGWNLCDGTNNTPDLRNRFIMGKNPGTNQTGPDGPITITLTNNNIPSHNHYLYTYSNSDSGGSVLGGGNYTYTCQQYGDIVSTVYGNSQGSNDTITIPYKPPYYTLAYIKKI